MSARAWIFPSAKSDLPRDWRRAIDDSGLPAPVRDAIVHVVACARLWRRERAAVASELIAHFGDALASGETVEAAIAAFGDVRTAAKLIRRAKRRQRPVAWHALSVLVRATLVVFAIYGVVLVRFLVGRPDVKVDYAMQLAGDAGRVPAADRGWPLYQRAIAILEAKRDDLLDAPLADQRDSSWVRTLDEATPTDVEWPQFGAWLDARADAIALARAGAAKAALALPFADLDPAIRSNDRPLARGVLNVAATNGLSRVESVLELDLRHAVAAGDGGRVEADAVARLDLADQRRREPLSGSWPSQDELTLSRLERALRDRPTMFDDAALVRIAHRVARLGGETASSLVDLRTEQLARLDALQRLYTDDGHGDGRLTPDGVRGLVGVTMRPVDRAAVALVGGAASPFASRAEERSRLDRVIAAAEARLARPLRELVAAGIDSTGNDLYLSANSVERRSAFPDPFAVQGIGFAFEQIRAEQLLGRRDGVLVGIALEAYRRRHGEYPSTLAALVPLMLPRVPVDRITGDPLRYRVVERAPVVYSLGVDRDDDGGRAPLDGDGLPAPRDAAWWEWRDTKRKLPDGDWVVFDGRPTRGR